MRYGQATSAITRVGRAPAMHSGMTRVGFSPTPNSTGQPAPLPVRTGQVQVTNSQGQVSANTSSTIFMGSVLAINTVPAAVAGTPGTFNMTFVPCEPVVIVDFEITDQSGQLLITNIFTCRSPIFEGGFMSVAALQSASTSRPMWTRALQRLILMQTVPLTITFANPTGGALNVSGGLLVVPIALNTVLPQETEAALARYNQC